MPSFTGILRQPYDPTGGSVSFTDYTNFDGIDNAVGTLSPMGVGNAGRLAMSFWWRPNATDSPASTNTIFSFDAEETLGDAHAVLRVQQIYSGGNWGLQLFAQFGDPTLVKKIHQTTTGYNITPDVWHHVLITIDAEPAGTRIYEIWVDDVSQALASITDLQMANFLMNQVDSDFHFGRYEAAANFYTGGDFTRVWISIDSQWLDFSVLANRRKFIDASGQPVDVGANGQTPTGTSPELYAKDGDLRVNTGSKANWSILAGDTAPTNFP